MKINEIFTSIQGETSFAGFPFTFIRLTGCNLRCSYCDTMYAYEEGTYFSVAEAVAEVKRRGMQRVNITGGEPLIQQEEVLPFSKILVDEGYTVLLETNGSIPIKDVDLRVYKIVDLKCPGSGMSMHMDFSNVEYLTMHDEVKFVISHREDFLWALDIIKKYDIEKRAQIIFSPAFNKVHPKNLAEWILAEELNIRLQLQLHKYIWPDRERGI